MAIITLNGITLPPDLVWSDEFAPWAVEQTTEWSLSGALMLQDGLKLKGRPVTLSGGPNAAWCDRSVLEQIVALQSQRSAMTLVYGTQTLSVRFAAPKAWDAKPVIDYADNGQPADKYEITLYFIEV